MTAQFPLYLIPLLPLIGATISLLVGRRWGKNAVTLLTCGSVAASAIVTVKAVLTLHEKVDEKGSLVSTFFNAPWMKAGDLDLSAGLALDHLSAVLCLVVTGIGFLIHVYSTAYMEHDERYTRFFAFLNLFTGSMLILVLGDSLPVTFVGWEGVGLCSYLLIGFWLDKDANALAGRKAFVVNRIGDFGFLLAMFLIFTKTGTLKYSTLATHLDGLKDIMWWGQPAAYFVGLLVLLGATGKSAQIPLYVWLPDAMAGPTPVSALIHAATMVTAGVYVVARLHFVFEIAPVTLAAVSIVGALTALFAATIGIAQRDMKKVLAYSTISQLGFMFVGVGTYVSMGEGLGGSANYVAGIFHLVTHAFFKAGLFLGAGSVMHALDGEGDIMRMGGLKKWMPITRWTFLIYCLAIAGIFPLAGFWSKDAILGGEADARWYVGDHHSWIEEKLWTTMPNGQHFIQLGHILYPIMLLAAGCTAFYMFRLYFLVFEGEYRGGATADAHGHGGHGHDDHGHDDHGHGGGHHEPHESPPAMSWVLILLALGTVLVGLLGIPNALWAGHDFFGEWLEPVVGKFTTTEPETAARFLFGAGIATLVSAAGIALAWVMYGHGVSAGVRNFVAKVPGLYRVVFNKYYVDEFYDLVVVRPVRWIAFALWKAVDAFVIDLIFVNGVGFIVSGFGKLSKYLQNGDLQRYIVAVLVGAAGLVYVATNRDAHRAADFDVHVNGREVEVVPHGAGKTSQRLTYKVIWDDKGTASATKQKPEFHYTYESPGKHEITVEVSDPLWGTTVHKSKTVKVQ
jgi:NADH-quinone oxidoreductase subunit L